MDALESGQVAFDLFRLLGHLMSCLADVAMLTPKETKRDVAKDDADQLARIKSPYQAVPYSSRMTSATFRIKRVNMEVVSVQDL